MWFGVYCTFLRRTTRRMPFLVCYSLATVLSSVLHICVAQDWNRTYLLGTRSHIPERVLKSRGKHAVTARVKPGSCLGNLLAAGRRKRSDNPRLLFFVFLQVEQNYHHQTTSISIPVVLEGARETSSTYTGTIGQRSADDVVAISQTNIQTRNILHVHRPQGRREVKSTKLSVRFRAWIMMKRKAYQCS